MGRRETVGAILSNIHLQTHATQASPNSPAGLIPWCLGFHDGDRLWRSRGPALSIISVYTMLVMPGMKHLIYKSIGAPMRHEWVLGPGERHTIGK